MTDWFARPVLHVKNVDASLRFYVNLLGFTSPWRYDEEGRARVAQVDRQGCALILANNLAPEKIGKGVIFISLNSSRRRPRPRSPRWMRYAQNSSPRAFQSRRVHGAIDFWWSMISTAISSSSTIRARLHPPTLLEMKTMLSRTKDRF